MPDEIQVLEFELGSERYCVDITVVAEVVKRAEDEVTPVPNSAPHVEGVMDLRGRTTEIVNPRLLLESPESASDEGGQHIIVFDPKLAEMDHMGWSVDAVDRVSRLQLEDVEETVDDPAINGIVNRDDGFIVWTAPDIATG